MLTLAQFCDIKSSGNLPSPKGAALKYIELSQKKNVPLSELIDVLHTDPAMAGRILKLANSSACHRARPAAGLTLNVLMSIGLQAIRQVVVCFSLITEYRNGFCTNFNFDLFWSRSLATALAAKLLGSNTEVAPAAEMFTLGLLVDIGRLALATLNAQRYNEILLEVGGMYADQLAVRENESFGYNHVDIGVAMMREWGLPKLFTDSVLYCENPEQARFAEGSRSARLLASLILSRQLAALCFQSESERATGFIALSTLAQTLDIDEANLKLLSDQMLSEWEKWSKMLTLPVPEVKPFSALDNSAQSTEVDPESNHAKAFNSIEALVVEEDPATCLVLEKLLTKSGHQVTVAHSGKLALESVLRRAPQLVIISLAMSHTDGMDLIRKLRNIQMGRYIYIYICVTSVVDHPEILQQALDLGADNFITKPVDASLLRARLKAGMLEIHERQQIKQAQEVLSQQYLELSLANQRAQEASLTDMLTGLNNRRCAMQRLAQAWSDAERGGKPLSLLILDIDHFKAVNDSCGHEIGDEALKQIANILLATVRMQDMVFRYGGEEFLVLAPNTDAQKAVQLAERIRLVIAGYAVQASEHQFHLTVSIGLTEKYKHIGSVNALLKAADTALYRAKEMGRNLVISAPCSTE